jgi:hypothetical protein
MLVLPLLVAVLDNEDDGVCITALTALRKVGGIDENVLSRIDRILTKGGSDLRAAAAAALADTPPRAQPQAVAVLRRALVPQTKGMLARIRGPAAGVEQDTVVVLALVRTVLAIGGPEGREAVEIRAAHAEEPLRSQILDLMPRG